MISNDLLQSNYLGRDGFKWWIGQIADPDTSGWGKAKESQNKRRFKPDNQEGLEHEVYERRCKVRILGYHTISDADGYVLQDSELPWAHILVPAGTGLTKIEWDKQARELDKARLEELKKQFNRFLETQD